MPSADQVPVINPHSTMRWHKWVVLIAGSTGSALRAVRPPNLHITPDVRRDLVYKWLRDLPGTARLMTASPRSPSPSQEPSGTVRASSASGIEKIDRRLRLGHEDSIRQTDPLRDLYESLYRAWARPGVQLAGRAIRCCLRLYQESGPCRLDPDPFPL